MRNLIKMERYKLFHDKLFLALLIAYAVLGFTGSGGYKLSYSTVDDISIRVDSLYTLFNAMAADMLILLVPAGAMLALVTGREFSGRNISQLISSGHARWQILLAKAVVFLPAYAFAALCFPFGGTIREIGNYSLTEPGLLLLHIVRNALYLWFLVMALFSLSMVFGFVIQNGVAAGIAGMITHFGLMYLFATLAGFGMHHINAVLPLYHMRYILKPTLPFLQITPILVGVLWLVAGFSFIWYKFKRSDIK